MRKNIHEMYAFGCDGCSVCVCVCVCVCVYALGCDGYGGVTCVGKLTAMARAAGPYAWWSTRSLGVCIVCVCVCV